MQTPQLQRFRIHVSRCFHYKSIMNTPSLTAERGSAVRPTPGPERRTRDIRSSRVRFHYNFHSLSPERVEMACFCHSSYLMHSYVSSMSVRLHAAKRSKLIDGSGNDHPLPHLLEHFLSSLAPFAGCALVELTQQGVFIHPLHCEAHLTTRRYIWAFSSLLLLHI